MKRDYFAELDCDCFDLDSWYITNRPHIYDAVKYLSDYSAALNILAMDFIENKFDKAELTK